MPLPGDNRCPLCRAALWAPDDKVVATKKCPRCGADLWVLVVLDGPVFFLRQPGQTRIAFLAALTAPLLGKSEEEMTVVLEGADSLDIVELIMDIEDALRSGRR